jgi:hypothetical protein
VWEREWMAENGVSGGAKWGWGEEQGDAGGARLAVQSLRVVEERVHAA